MPWKLSITFCNLLLALIAMACTTVSTIHTVIPTYPSHQLDSTQRKAVILNSFSVHSKSYRKNKESEFNQLVHDAMEHMATQIKQEKGSDAKVISSILTPIPVGNELSDLMRSNESTYAIFIKSFNAFFDQTHVEVTKTDAGKNREAFYDIVVEMEYAFRSLGGLKFDTLIRVSKFHSSRAVFSGLFAAGPNIVLNSKDALDGVFVNVDLYLQSFFPGKTDRLRVLSLSKEFQLISKAIRSFNWATAFEESKRLCDSPDKKISATAYFVCAVLAENDGNYELVKGFLKRSLKQRYSVNAQRMLDDYKHAP
jgi:hypothetical protein